MGWEPDKFNIFPGLFRTMYLKKLAQHAKKAN